MSREPNALDALAHIGRTVAYYGCIGIILVCMLLAWVGIPE